MAIQNYSTLIQNASQKYGVPADLIAAVIQVESSGNPNAASGTGPVGLMQVSNAVAKDYGYEKHERLDPAKNIDMGTRYLRDNLKAFNGDLPKALLGYNQGTAGARAMISGRKPMAEEGFRYIRNPNFRGFVSPQATLGADTSGDLEQVANPMGVLSQSKPQDKFDPALLNLTTAQQSPNQAQAMAGSALPILAQEDGEVPERQNNWGDAALGALAMLAGKQPNKIDQSRNLGIGSGPSGWNNDTRRVMQMLGSIGAPTWFGK